MGWEAQRAVAYPRLLPLRGRHDRWYQNLWEAGRLPRPHPEKRAQASSALKLPSISLGFLLFLAHSITKHQIMWLEEQTFSRHSGGTRIKCAREFAFWLELSSRLADVRRLLSVPSHGLALVTAEKGQALKSLPPLFFF